MKKALFLLLSLISGALVAASISVPVAQPADAGTPQPYCCTALTIATATPQIAVLPAVSWTYDCGTSGVDPGATFDQHLMTILETQCINVANGTSGSVTSNCTGQCLLLMYADLNLAYCSDSSTSSFPEHSEFSAASESWFMHLRTSAGWTNPAPDPTPTGNGNISSTNRMTEYNTHSKCGSYGGTSDITYWMNPGNTSRLAWEWTNWWQSTAGVISNGVGIMSDDTPHEGAWAYDVNKSAEYGGASNGYWFKTGTDTNSQGYDYEEAVAKFISNACQTGTNANCVPMALNSLGGGASIGYTSLSVRGGTHLVGELSPSLYAAGYLDGVPDIADLCANLTTTNLKGLFYELPVTSGGGYVPYLSSSVVNEAIDVVHAHSTDNCAATKIIIADDPNVISGVQPYLMALAGLVPSNDGSPDEITNQIYALGGTYSNTDFPYYWFYTFVGFNPIETLSPIVYHGTHTNYSMLGCESFGDSGGTVGLVWGFTGSGASCLPQYGMEYNDFYINKVDQGCAAYVVNLSTSSVALSSLTGSMQNPNCYDYATTFSGGEVGVNSSVNGTPTSSIPYTGVSGNAISASACSNTTAGKCDGSYVWNGTALCASPPCHGTFSYTIPAHTGILIHSQGSGGGGGSSSVYTFTGCPSNVQVYGSSGTADPYLQKDWTGVTPDTNSANIISNISGNDNAIDPTDYSGDEEMNCATTSTATYTVQTNGGHSTPISPNSNQGIGGNGSGGSGIGATIPWQSSFFIEGVGDEHGAVLNYQSGIETECYHSVFTGTQFKCYAGDQVNLGATFYNNWYPSGTTYGDNVTGGGEPILGFVDLGDDDNSANQSNQIIPHPLALAVDTVDYINNYISGSSTNLSIQSLGYMNGSCGSSITLCLIAGDTLRLKPTYTCPTTHIEDLMVCNQLKKFGFVVVDTAGSNEVRFGMTTSGVDPWPSDLFTWLGGLTLSADFDVMPRGSNQP